TVNTLFTSLTQGLPTTFGQTLNWVLTGQTPGFVPPSPATVNSLQANPATLAVAAATPSLQDNPLARGLQGLADFVFWLSNTNAFPGPLPTGFTPATYPSLFKVAQNLVNVAILPFTVGNLLLTGQFDKDAAPPSYTVNTLFTSLTQGLPTTFGQTLN